MKKKIYLLFLLLLYILACSDSKEDNNSILFQWEEITIDGLKNQVNYTDVDIEPTIILRFSEPVHENTIKENIQVTDEKNQPVELNISIQDERTLNVKPVNLLQPYTDYKLTILPNLTSKNGTRLFTGKVFTFTTGADLTDKFPRLTDEELLNLVQSQTFKYFWDFGHPVSGMARERTKSGDVVTTGGTGFGIMSMLVAVERGFITRTEAYERIEKIADFLQNECTSYHGAYAHWINGATGETQPFSEYDNGADLVETAFLFQGLLTARQYFNNENESELRETITRLWENIEWTWFQKADENVLYWHWSPDFEWKMNLPIRGWNEALITYVLAAASPTYPISPEVYQQGWAQNGGMKNGNRYYGYVLPLGEANGGPLFFSQFSFLGINPTGLTDTYANYWEQNRNHTLINYTYCTTNPKGYRGYTEDCWGLTASDGNTGYSAHSPTNDTGVIAPTAAISAMPYTPGESMAALHFFYYKLGDKLWSEYGFYDAFNLTANWYDDQHLAIDQGPIICMIENYRSGLLWSLFMADPEIKAGLRKLGFQSPEL